MEVVDLAGQPPDLARERGEHRSAQRGLGVDEAMERVATEDERFDGPDRDRRRGARAAVEQRQLAEEAAPTDGRQDDGFGAFVGRQDDLDLAARDHEQRVARIVEMEDHLAPPKAASAHRVSANVSVASSSSANSGQEWSASRASATSAAGLTMHASYALDRARGR